MGEVPAPARLWRTWEVTVRDSLNAPARYAGPTAGAARYSAWLDFSDLRPDWTFRDFIGQSAVRPLAGEPRPDGYDYVRRCYRVDVRIGARVRLRREGPGLDGREGIVVYPDALSTAHVHVVLDGDRRASIVHPDSVEIIPA